jgi:hypothetical protein
MRTWMMERVTIGKNVGFGLRRIHNQHCQV